MTATQQIDEQIERLGDWRGTLMAQLRSLILQTIPDVQEEWKWQTGIWAYDGMICAIAPFQDHVKINFFQGAYFEDATSLFNSGLEAQASRAINFFKGDVLPEKQLADLIRTAANYNTARLST
jgi:hypothetical protein